MTRNKRLPRYRRKHAAGGLRKKSLFARLGARMDRWWRRLKGFEIEEPGTRPSAFSTHGEHIDLSDLKIAIPKKRKRPESSQSSSDENQLPVTPSNIKAAMEAFNSDANEENALTPAADKKAGAAPLAVTADNNRAAPKPKAKSADDDKPSEKRIPEKKTEKKADTGVPATSSSACACEADPEAGKNNLERIRRASLNKRPVHPAKAKTEAQPTSAATEKNLAASRALEAQEKSIPPAASIPADADIPKKATTESISSNRGLSRAAAWPGKAPEPPMPPLPPRSERPRRRTWVTMGLVAVLLATGLVFGLSYMSRQEKSPRAKVARIPAANLPKVAALTPGFYEVYEKKFQSSQYGEFTIVTGSTLGQAMESLGVGVNNRGKAIIEALTSEGGVGVVRPGAVIRAFWKDREQNLLSRVEYLPATGGEPFVVIPKAENGFWRYSLSSKPITVIGAREGRVDSSLWEAGSRAGLDPGLIMSLADVMASDIDFLTDIKKGDSFQVLYSRDYCDGRPQGTPLIEMVKMVNKGREYEYFRYVDSQGNAGYYDKERKSSKKTFFITPLQYKRISSRFTMNRLHPIHKVVRPHQGVDYAAPTGTPVSTVADGTVIFCGWNGGYGRLITIKHDDVYTTMYAHLSRFADGIKKGSVVKQGDLIGYVGATGTATGPHLDFRLKKKGTFMDPEQELAKQEGKALDALNSQAFTQVASMARLKMNHYLAKSQGNRETE